MVELALVVARPLYSTTYFMKAYSIKRCSIPGHHRSGTGSPMPIVSNAMQNWMRDASIKLVDYTKILVHSTSAAVRDLWINDVGARQLLSLASNSYPSAA